MSTNVSLCKQDLPLANSRISLVKMWDRCLSDLQYLRKVAILSAAANFTAAAPLARRSNAMGTKLENITSLGKHSISLWKECEVQFITIFAAWHALGRLTCCKHYK